MFPDVDSSSSSETPLIGRLLMSEGVLAREDIPKIMAYQQARGLRFGQAAIALNLATSDQIFSALSKQFHFAYNPEFSHSRLPLLGMPFGQQADVFRELCSQILLNASVSEGATNCLAVVSPNPGDGKSYITSNLGVAFSQYGRRTLIIDADLRRPQQHEIFNLAQSTSGLSNILAGSVVENAIRAVDGIAGLFVLPIGTLPPNPIELLQRSIFPLLLMRFVETFDIILVDTPAASRGADYKVLAAACKSSLIVGRRNVTPLGALRDIQATLSHLQVKTAGVVMNNV